MIVPVQNFQNKMEIEMEKNVLMHLCYCCINDTDHYRIIVCKHE